MPIRVLVVSNFHLLLRYLTELIKSQPQSFALAGATSSFDEALDLIKQTSAEVVLLDIDSGAESALGLISALHEISPSKVLLLTRLQDHALQDKAIVLGARGTIERHTSPALLLDALQKVHQGQIWLNHEATGRVFVALSRISNKKPANDPAEKISRLTAREQEIVKCLARSNGEPAKTMAAKLHVSESTLRNHLTAIYDKLGVSNRHGLVAYAFQNGLTARVGLS
jgi:two-component system, NarL family, nitrate/nitrite response regulator NarL